ncbi:MAG: undecaprenyl/decaprenyl-phosphate alpha-N-acetylglucosaminyl 1-phosphate transferase [Deltaproteobacteria bacterium]|nr:undecaprenyl/decaprenyl-phosphate alpha-N-acetylglucosaminyl 1-phosphate transferase [Deltaproteobacteria bacterium]
MPQVLAIFFITFLISFIIQYVCVKLFPRCAFCIDPGDSDKPQRFHAIPTPRTGGMGIVIAFAVGSVLAGINLAIQDKFILVAVSSLPAYASGFYEDIRSDISPKLRLIIMGIGALVAMVSLDVILYDLGVFRLTSWAAIVFTLFAVVGVANSINIIDGFNGLASGVAVVALSFFALVSHIHHDQFILAVNIIAIASIAGFMIWNFPSGKIFLGDGGAYFIGFLLAIESILLVRNNIEISPWYPLVVLAYPVFEVFFSIYRKKFKRGGSPFKPDSVHFHMLIHKRISRNNPKTSLYLWTLTLTFNIMAFPFRSDTYILIVIFCLFSLTYIYFYRGLVRFKKIGLLNLAKTKMG